MFIKNLQDIPRSGYLATVIKLDMISGEDYGHLDSYSYFGETEDDANIYIENRRKDSCVIFSSVTPLFLNIPCEEAASMVIEQRRKEINALREEFLARIETNRDDIARLLALTHQTQPEGEFIPAEESDPSLTTRWAKEPWKEDNPSNAEDPDAPDSGS